MRGGSAGFLRSLVSVGGWQESLRKIKVYSNLVAAEEGREGGSNGCFVEFRKFEEEFRDPGSS